MAFQKSENNFFLEGFDFLVLVCFFSAGYHTFCCLRNWLTDNKEQKLLRRIKYLVNWQVKACVLKAFIFLFHFKEAHWKGYFLCSWEIQTRFVSFFSLASESPMFNSNITPSLNFFSTPLIRSNEKQVPEGQRLCLSFEFSVSTEFGI